jgi:hypothetical protein
MSWGEKEMGRLNVPDKKIKESRRHLIDMMDENRTDPIHSNSSNNLDLDAFLSKVRTVLQPLLLAERAISKSEGSEEFPYLKCAGPMVLSAQGARIKHTAKLRAESCCNVIGVIIKRF